MTGDGIAGRLAELRSQNPASRPKERVTLHTTPELADRMRRAACLPGVSLASLCEAAIMAELDRLEKVHRHAEADPAGEVRADRATAKRPDL